MSSRVGNWMFTFGIASLLIAGSNIASVAQLPIPGRAPGVVNECEPNNNPLSPKCEGRCVAGSTSWSCTPGVETRTINGEEIQVVACYCE